MKTPNKPTKSRNRSKGHDGKVIVQRGNRWLARVWLADGKGGGRYRNKSHDTEEQAEAWASKQRGFINPPDEKPRVISVIDDIWPEVEEGIKHTSPSNQHRVKMFVDRIAKAAPNMGQPLIWAQQVKEAEQALTAQRVKEQRSRPAGAAVRGKFRNTARLLVKVATSMQLISFDPLAWWPVESQPRPTRPIWTVADARKLVSDDMSDDRWHSIACALIYTGLRSSIVRNMRGDWIRGNLLIVPSTARGNQKSKNEFQQAIEPEWRPLLDDLLAKYGNGPLFPEFINMTAGGFSNGWRKYCVRAGAENLTCHTCRHWHISALVAMGFTLEQAMGRVGQRDRETNMDYQKNADRIRHEVIGWRKQLRLREVKSTGKVIAFRSA